MDNRFYKFLIEHTPVGYCYRRIILDDAGNPVDYELVDINSAFSDMIGRKAGDILGKTGRELGMDLSGKPFDWLGFYCRIALECGSGSVDHFIPEKGRYYRLNVYSPEKFHFATFYTDITSDIVELRELEKFFNVSLDMLSITDTTGRIIKVNNQWETTLGYDVDALLKMNLDELILPEDLEATRIARASLSKGKLLLNYTNRLRSRDGSYRYIEWRAYPSDGLIYASARDVTDAVQEKKSIIRYAELPAKIFHMELEEINFHEILEIIRDISQARVVMLNLLQGAAKKMKVVDVAGDKEAIDALRAFHGSSRLDRYWKRAPRYFRMKDASSILVFNSFLEYADNCGMRRERAEQFDGSLQTGEVVVARFQQSGKPLGDFTLMLPEGVSLRSNDLTLTIIRQFSMIISRKYTEQLLRKSEERFKTMFEEAPLGIGLFEIHSGRPIQINRKFTEIVGRTKEEMLGLDWQTITHPDDMALNEAKRQLLFDGLISDFSINKRYLKPDGSVVWINLTIVPLKDEDEDVPLELCMIEDITERKNREEEIVFLNYHDSLTGLYNRTFLDEEKKRLDVERQLPLSVIMGDINGLKLVNDAFGHVEGDKLLVEIARILEQCCRSEDIIARTGGDEFCILLPRTSGEAAEEICRRITAMCRTHKHLTGQDAFYPGIALGSATKESIDTPIDKIINEAEDSMYKRKLLERKSIHSSIIASIRTALFEKSNETEQHAERMAALAEAIGRTLRLTDKQMNDLRLLATLHDIGKVSIDDRILTKRGTLTDEEWLEMRRHPDIGYRIANASFELSSIADYILSHHERWDGSGYPQGLAGESIPLLARIVSVVDAFDAMTEDRPYRKALTPNAALEEIRRHAGTQFDPKIAQIFAEHVITRAESDPDAEPEKVSQR